MPHPTPFGLPTDPPPLPFAAYRGRGQERPLPRERGLCTAAGATRPRGLPASSGKGDDQSVTATRPAEAGRPRTAATAENEPKYDARCWHTRNRRDDGKCGGDRGCYRSARVVSSCRRVPNRGDRTGKCVAVLSQAAANTVPIFGAFRAWGRGVRGCSRNERRCVDPLTPGVRSVRGSLGTGGTSNRAVTSAAFADIGNNTQR